MCIQDCFSVTSSAVEDAFFFPCSWAAACRILIKEDKNTRNRDFILLITGIHQRVGRKSCFIIISVSYGCEIYHEEYTH